MLPAVSAAAAPAAVSAGPARAWPVALARDMSGHYFTPRTAAILLGGAALAGLSAAHEDANATARALEHPGFDQVSDAGNVYGNGVTLGAVALALYAGGARFGDANTREAGIEAARSLLVAYTGVAGLKLAFHRTRPDGGSYSFPSGHTAGAFAIAPVLARHYGVAGAIPAYALALATSIGRLEDRKHYLSDVIFGAALGTSAGLMDSSRGAKRDGMSLLLEPGRAGAMLRF